MVNILLVVPARQKEEIFNLHKQSLDNLKIPGGVSLTRLFILHNSPELKKYLGENDLHQEITTDEKYEKDEITHYWKNENLKFITELKNGIFEHVKQSNYDYLFLVDSDLVLHPDTLINLLKAKKEIVAEVFWTKWNVLDKNEMPNAWDLDAYIFIKGTLEKYRQKGLYECGGTGACILIHRNVIDAGVSYIPIKNVSFWGEDRAFCIRASVAGFDIYIDTHSPAYHIYRDENIYEGKKVLEEFKNEVHNTEL
jgi:cellulose synthase/poly-beta-1,6-N-acetylglucosamine synthase-like glycosyltransferase